ncbi:MAG: PBP1A family penicillin-binding protein [Alphaproteobacteria bacterium]
MADPEDPIPPIEGGAQDTDSASEKSDVETSSGSGKPPVGDSAAPAFPRADKTAPNEESPTDAFQTARAQVREDAPEAQVEGAQAAAAPEEAEPETTILQAAIDERPVPPEPAALVLEEAVEAAAAPVQAADSAETDPEPSVEPTDEPTAAHIEQTEILEEGESGLPEAAAAVEPSEPASDEIEFLEDVERDQPALASESGTQAPIADEVGQDESEADAAPEAPEELDTPLAAFEAASAATSEVGVPEPDFHRAGEAANIEPPAQAEEIEPAPEIAAIESEPEIEPIAETLAPAMALQETAEPEPPTVLADSSTPEDAVEEDSPAEPESAIAAREADATEAAVDIIANDEALFIDAPPEEEAPTDSTLFPATPAGDEAALFTPGVNDAPEAVAEIIPYVPPVDIPPAQAAAADVPEAAPVAARAPEDLAAPPLPVQSSVLDAAFAWIGAQTHSALFWLRARLPKGPEKPDAPTLPIPSRRRTHWPAQRKPEPRPPGFRPDMRRIAIMSGWAAVFITAAIAGFFIYLTRDMPSTRSLWTADNSPSLTFVDRRGRVIIREGAENAPPVDLNRLPPYVPQAIIAIEDRRFYEHIGIDVSGLMRAAASNMKAGHVVQGGSTITQQLAKNLFLTNNRTFQRKLQEVALALWLESQFSKRDILALYISRVYFGAGAYGIEAAAERYFDKPAKDLTLAEAALLAGLVKAPSKLNPAAQDAAAKQRAKIVLDEMVSAGFITPAQHLAALKAPLTISRNNPNGNLGYFRDWIDPQLNQLLGDQRDDFIIETTLDLDAQRAAEQTLDRVIDRERKLRNVTQGAVLAMDSTGGVTTMVGGLNYGKGPGQSEFNRTTQSLRAPGSSFKYFIYMTAMAKGMSPWDIYVDKPVVYGDWAPGNYEDKYYGPVTLASAYAKSLNMVAIQLANDVSGAAVIATAHNLGVGKRLADYRSLGLGAQGMTVMEMVTGYGAMASGGYPIEPHGIERIRRANGQVLWARRSATPPRQVIDDRTMRMMNYLGSGVVRAGTGTRAQIPGREIAGKTGTSNDYRDAWFIGYVPGMVAGVWLGNDNNTSMTKVTGGLLATEVWHDFMVVALRDTPIQQLLMPEAEELPMEPPGEVVTETPPAAVVTAPPLAPETPPPPLMTPVGGDG